VTQRDKIGHHATGGRHDLVTGGMRWGKRICSSVQAMRAQIALMLITGKDFMR